MPTSKSFVATARTLARWGNLGTLLYNAGYRSAARLTYGEALKHHPRDLRTLINLANALLENNELAFSRDLYGRLPISRDVACPAQSLSLTRCVVRSGCSVLDRRRNCWEFKGRFRFMEDYRNRTYQAANLERKAVLARTGKQQRV